MRYNDGTEYTEILQATSRRAWSTFKDQIHSDVGKLEMVHKSTRRNSVRKRTYILKEKSISKNTKWKIIGWLTVT